LLDDQNVPLAGLYFLQKLMIDAKTKNIVSVKVAR
jgi:hypothetical protein